MNLSYGQKERHFSLVGKNCISCQSDCRTVDASNLDHHAFSIDLNVNGIKKTLTLCDHPQSSSRGEVSIRKVSDAVNYCRVCLVKQPDFDTTAKVEIPTIT